MYDFSGVFFRIWGVCGIIFLLGIILIVLEKPWKSGFSIKKCKFGLLLLVVAVSFALVYAYGIVFKNVSSYTGTFVETHRNSRVAPPLLVTFEYVFDDGENLKQRFYIDAFSKKKVFPSEFEYNQTYTIYFDKFTKVIVKVEENTEKTGDDSIPTE